MKNSILFCLIAHACVTHAQFSTSLQFPAINTGRPNTDETRKLTSTPQIDINYSTGALHTTLPIYTAVSGNLTLPIKLSYDASGIKVDDDASWVGLGWTLNTGSYIYREIKGNPDENFYLVNGSLYSGNISISNWISQWITDYCDKVMDLTIPSITNFQGLPVSNSPGNYHYFWTKCAERLAPCGVSTGPTRDIQPDLYTAIINGDKVDFVFDVNRTPFILNNEGKYTILHDKNNFTIIDENGTRYFFSLSDAEKILTSTGLMGSTYYNEATPGLTYYDMNFWDNSNSYNQFGCNTNSAFGLNSTPKVRWNLTKIESADGKYKIDLSYDTYKYRKQVPSFVYAINKNNYQQYSYQYNDAFYPWESLANDHGIIVQLSDHTYSAKRLKKITWKDGYMVFTAGAVREDVYPLPNSDARSLESIKVYDNANVEQHRFTLQYDYFNTPGNTVDGFTFRNKRLKLLSLTQTGSDGVTQLPPYLFEYNSTPLPVKYSFQKDFWGYYKANNATHLQGTNYYYANYSNTDLGDFKLWSQFSIYPISLPGSGVPTTVPGVNRLPDLSSTQACVLQKVTTPLKGYQEFEYELHTFCIDNDLTNRTAGGLRIKKITTSDGTNMGKNMVRNFYYDYENTYLNGSVKRSSGEINFLPVFGRDNLDVYNNIQFDNFKIHSESFASNVNNMGSTVFYREVMEEQPGIGATIYKFNNAGTFGHNSDVPIDSDYLVKKAKSDIAHYTPIITNPDRFDIQIKRANYPYAPEPNTDWGNGVPAEMLVRDNTGNTVYKKTYSYSIRDYAKLKTYDVTTFLLTKEYYTAQSGIGPMHRSLCMVPYYYLSVWKTLDSETEYIYDPAYPNNITNAMVKTISYAYHAATGAHKFPIARTSTSSNGKTMSEEYKYVADYSITNPQSLASSVPDAASLALLNMRYTTKQLKNPVEEKITQVLNGSTYVSSGRLFTYRDLTNAYTNNTLSNSNPPVIRQAEVYNFEVSTPLALSSFAASAVNQSGNNINFTFDSNFKRKITNEYFDTQGNLLQSRIEGGPASAYLYGYGSYVPIAAVENATCREIFYTSFESEEVQNITHTPTNIISTEKHTGTKSYQMAAPVSPATQVSDLQVQNIPANLDPAGRYVFSCWVKTPSNYPNNGANLVIHTNNGSAFTSVYPTNAAAANITSFISNTNGTWQYYQVVLDLAKVYSQSGLSPYPSGPGLGITCFVRNQCNTAVYIDDVQLRPYNSSMTTQTVKPLIGTTSTTDSRNTSELFEYDVFGRLKLHRDLNNNIIEKRKYNFKGIINCPNCQ